jgi:hypothetical protein
VPVEYAQIVSQLFGKVLVYPVRAIGSL